jgi:hypothetical protein
MQDRNHQHGTVSRRAFLRGTGATVALAAFGVEFAAAHSAPGARIDTGAAVATVFLDRPYVDPTGRADAYRPPEVVGDRPAARDDCCVIAFL